MPQLSRIVSSLPENNLRAMLLFTRILVLSPIFVAFVVLSPSADANETTTTSTEYNVSKEECINAVGSSFMGPLCCFKFEGNLDNATQTCSVKSTMNGGNNTEEMQLSIFAECVYRSKNYIKSPDELDMDRVKSDANELYGNDTFAARLTIDMYRNCEQTARTIIEDYRSDPTTLKNPHQSYYTIFVWILGCVLDFSETNCPYFRWINKHGTKDHSCAEYAKQCDKYLDEINAMPL